MAPEQTGRMNRSIDSRSDLYSLGVTFYQVLTGALPFTASDPMQWVHCHVARQPVAPDQYAKEIPAPLSAIVMKLLAKTAEERYQTAAEERYQTAAGVAHDLRRCLKEWDAHCHIMVRRLQALESFKLLRAPFDGVVTSRNTDLGALITAGSGKPLFTVAQVNPLRVYVSVPENFGRDVHIGTKAELSFDEFPSHRFAAEVVATSGAIDPTTRTLLTELKVPNQSNKLWPGAYAIVHFDLQGTGHSLLIPANTLLFRSEGAAVGVVGADGKVQIRNIEIGTDLGTQLEVVKGLSPTDRLIVYPSDSLSDGVEVQIINPNLNSSPVAKN